jgi:O-antigen/teichoic acid export membrane protein
VLAYGSVDFFVKLTQFLVIPVYAYALTVSEFGILASLLVLSLLVATLANLGVNNGVQRYYFDSSVGSEERPLLVSTGLAQLVASSLATSLLLGLAVFAARDLLRDSYGLEWPLLALAVLIVVPDQIAQYCLDTLRLHFSPRRFAIVALAKNVAGLLLGIWLLVVLGWGVAGVLIGTLAGAVAAAPLGVALIRKDLVLGFSRQMARRVFAFGFPYVFVAAAYWIFNSMDRWVLMELGSLEELGIFSVAFRFAGVIVFLTTAFGLAWSPFAYRQAEVDPAHRAQFARILSLWCVVLAMSALAMSLFAGEVVALLTPSEYWQAAPIVPVALAGLAVHGTTLITGIGISLAKRTSLLIWGAWLTALVNLLLNISLVPTYGAMGSAVATLFAYLLLTSFYFFWTQRLHRIPVEPRSLVASAVLIGLTLLSPLAISTEIDPLIMAAKLILLLAAFGLVLAFKIIDPAVLGSLLRVRTD